jgi:hypothetical protein
MPEIYTGGRLDYLRSQFSTIGDWIQFHNSNTGGQFTYGSMATCVYDSLGRVPSSGKCTGATAGFWPPRSGWEEFWYALNHSASRGDQYFGRYVTNIRPSLEMPTCTNCGDEAP